MQISARFSHNSIINYAYISSIKETMTKTINCLWDYGFVLEYSEAIRNLFRPAYISGLLEIHPSSDSRSDKKIYIFIYPSRLLD